MLSLALLLVSPAAAQQFSVTINEDIANQAGVDPDDVRTALEGEVPGELHLGDEMQDYLVQMAEAAVLSTKGMGVDYASNPQSFMFGASVGSAVNGAGAQFGRGDATVTEGGFAFQTTAMAGLNLGAFSKNEKSFGRRFVLYGNGMMLEQQGDPFDAVLINYGAHLQAQLIRPRISGIAEWGGLAVTSGYQYASYKLELAYPLPMSTQGFTWNADGTYTISANTMSVPLEVSTNLRLLFLTVYGGVGQDLWSQGTSQGTVELAGPITTEVNGQEYRLGRASVSMDETATTDLLLPRAFVGVQIDALWLKLYGHLNADLNGGFGGHLGARMVFPGRKDRSADDADQPDDNPPPAVMHPEPRPLEPEEVDGVPAPEGSG